MNPYGIQQVDIPGVLGVYQSARQQRMREMQFKREQEQAGVEAERKLKRDSLLANIARTMQPKGGGRTSGVAGAAQAYGQSSQDGGFDARLNASPEQTQAPSAQPQQPSLDDMMSQLAELDFDTWSKIDARQREAVKQATTYLGNAAMDVSRLPEAERAAAWSRYVQQAEEGGMDIPAHLERYTPEALNQAVASSGFMEKMISRFEPDWRVVPEGGYLENVNPLARVAPREGGAQAGPQPGMVVDGYVFSGGNPNDPNNWRAAGGPTPTASGGFRP